MQETDAIETSTAHNVNVVSISPTAEITIPQTGHSYIGNTAENHDAATSGFGNLNMPGSDHHSHDREYDHQRNGPSETPHDNGEPALKHTEPPPPEYAKRDGEWFEPGRLLQVWDPDNRHKHKKEYVILDSLNVSGLCLVVHGHDHDPEYGHGHGHHRDHDVSFLDNHILIQKENDKKPADLKDLDQIVFLTKYSRALKGETWVHLGHNDNIRFDGLLCADCGFLNRKSLRDLRNWYLEWWKTRWE